MKLRLLALLGALFISACNSATVTESVALLAVTGTVRTTSGDALGGVVLNLQTRTAVSCANSGPDTPATSDAEGRFAATLGGFGVSGDVCVWIEVVPPAGSGAVTDTVTYQSRSGTEQPLVANVVLALQAAP